MAVGFPSHKLRHFPRPAAAWLGILIGDIEGTGGIEEGCAPCKRSNRNQGPTIDGDLHRSDLDEPRARPQTIMALASSEANATKASELPRFRRTRNTRTGDSLNPRNAFSPVHSGSSGRSSRRLPIVTSALGTETEDSGSGEGIE